MNPGLPILWANLRQGGPDLTMIGAPAGKTVARVPEGATRA
jgi:hypothetical protein